MFDRHLVPFTCTVGRPLAREPLVKALLRLASLPVNDFEQSALLDVVALPFYRGRINNIPVDERRPDVWRIAVASLGITKGNEDWSRLRASVTPLILQETAVDQEEDRRGPQIFDREQVTLLAELATGVIHDCELLPRRGSVGTLTAAFVELVHGHFVVSGLTEPESTVSDEETMSASVGSLIKDALDRLSELDPLGAELSWEEWTELFRLALEDTALPIEIELHRGVRVLDAMEARGLRMRAVFVLGLNEQLFPRVVREDPFLRDRQRSVLASTHGFAIEEKLARIIHDRFYCNRMPACHCGVWRHRSDGEWPVRWGGDLHGAANAAVWSRDDGSSRGLFVNGVCVGCRVTCE